MVGVSAGGRVGSGGLCAPGHGAGCRVFQHHDKLRDKCGKPGEASTDRMKLNDQRRASRAGLMMRCSPHGRSGRKRRRWHCCAP